MMEGKPREFIRHDPAGTRSYRRKRGLEEIEGIWDKVMNIRLPVLPAREIGQDVLNCLNPAIWEAEIMQYFNNEYEVII